MGERQRSTPASHAAYLPYESWSGTVEHWSTSHRRQKLHGWPILSPSNLPIVTSWHKIFMARDSERICCARVPRQTREFQCDFLFHGLPSSPLSFRLSPPTAVALRFDSSTKEILGSLSLTTSSFQVAAASSCPSVTDYTVPRCPTHLRDRLPYRL
jgi:hypothetical protein